MHIPVDLRYTLDHEWAKREDDLVVIGITDFAQKELGEIVFINLGNIGGYFETQGCFGEVESVKSVTELYMPLGGEVVALNDDLKHTPELVNDDPYGKGWMIKIRPKNPADFNTLLDAASYEEVIRPE